MFSNVEDPFVEIYLPIKIEDVDLKVFNIIKGKLNQKHLQLYLM